LPLLSKIEMSNAGRSALIFAGVGFGVLRGLRALGSINRKAARLGTIQSRIDTIQVAVVRLTEQNDQLQVKLGQRVTRDELTETIDRAFRQLEEQADTRYEKQNRAAEALRIMVGQTDELLQRVLDGLELIKDKQLPAEAGFEEAGRHWQQSQARH
jgi:hypothetical protein